MNLCKYNDFLYDTILLEIFSVNESNDENPITFEWDFTKEKNQTKNKLKSFLSKFPKETILKYLVKFLEKAKKLPEIAKRKTLLLYSGAFMAFLSSGYIKTHAPQDSEIVKEFVNITKFSSFDVSQSIVSIAEGGYSNDRHDTGNYVNFKMGGKIQKRFVGSKYGISAPILHKYLGRLPKKEDMENLSYEDALKIYKSKYWDKQSIHKYCNQSIANIIYDGCVNQGINGMKDVLRKVLKENGLNINDSINPFEDEWIKSINILDQEKAFNDIKKYREDRYRKARTFKVHGNGWLERLSKIEFSD